MRDEFEDGDGWRAWVDRAGSPLDAVASPVLGVSTDPTNLAVEARGQLSMQRLHEQRDTLSY